MFDFLFTCFFLIRLHKDTIRSVRWSYVVVYVFADHFLVFIVENLIISNCFSYFMCGLSYHVYCCERYKIFLFFDVVATNNNNNNKWKPLLSIVLKEVFLGRLFFKWKKMKKKNLNCHVGYCVVLEFALFYHVACLCLLLFRLIRSTHSIIITMKCDKTHSFAAKHIDVVTSQAVDKMCDIFKNVCCASPSGFCNIHFDKILPFRVKFIHIAYLCAIPSQCDYHIRYIFG